MPRMMLAVGAALALLINLSGCGSEGGPETVSVSGKVSVDGKPIEGAQVNFFSEEHNFVSTGVTDADGAYQLYAGAVPGENKVWISKMPPGGPAGDPEENPEIDPGQIEAMSEAEFPTEAVGNEELPAKFSDPDQTVLKFMVPEDGSDKADFKLTSK